MAFMDQVKRNYIAVGKRLFGVGRDDQYSAIINQYGTNTQPQYQLDYYRGFVYTCVNLIGDYAGQYEPKLMKKRTDAPEVVNEHPWLALMNNPQPDEPSGISRFDLFEATQSFIELTGEAFWYIVRGKLTNKPRAIYMLRPDRMGVDIDEQGTVNGYFMRRNAGSPIPFEVEEILHFKNFNPKNPYRGYGTLQAAMDYVQTDEFTSRFTKNFFVNNAGLNGVLSIKGEVSQNAFAKFVRQWREKYEGVDNAGKTAIVRESDVDFTKVGLGLNELDMQALRNMSKEDIAQAFRIPMPLLGKSDQNGLGRANVETLEYIFTKQTIEPKFRRIDSVMQKAIERYYPTDGVIASHENMIPSDKQFELDERKAGVDIWQTRNEIRDEDGKDHVDGGDELRAPLASAPISFDAVTSGKAASVRVKKKTVIKSTADDNEKIDLARKENFRESLMLNQVKYEKKYRAALKSLLETQRKEVINNLEPHGAKQKDLKSFLFDVSAAVGAFKLKLIPILESLYLSAGELALRFAGDETSTYEIRDAQRAYIAENLQRMANDVNNDTIDLLTNTLTEGIQAGESLSKLAKRVNTVYEQAQGYRAERIARTETLKASNQATNFAYGQTGYVKAKKWYTNPGSCPICDAMDGRTVNLEESYAEVGSSVEYVDANGDTKNYQVMYETVAAPPLHPNCRCTIVPVR